MENVSISLCLEDRHTFICGQLHSTPPVLANDLLTVELV